MLGTTVEQSNVSASAIPKRAATGRVQPIRLTRAPHVFVVTRFEVSRSHSTVACSGRVAANTTASATSSGRSIRARGGSPGRLVGIETIPDGSISGAGRNQREADARTLILGGERLVQPPHPVLGGGVCAVLRIGDMVRHASDRDVAASPDRPHRREQPLGQNERRPKIEGELSVELGRLRGFERLQARTRPRSAPRSRESPIRRECGRAPGQSRPTRARSQRRSRNWPCAPGSRLRAQPHHRCAGSGEGFRRPPVRSRVTHR